jgi:acyl carrier protein
LIETPCRFQVAERVSFSYNYVPPEDPLEPHIIRIWERVLRIQGVGANDDFLNLGGNSLRAIAVIALIRDKLEYDISPTEFFSYCYSQKTRKSYP